VPNEHPTFKKMRLDVYLCLNEMGDSSKKGVFFNALSLVYVESSLAKV
jgi:hypothetical protein